MSNESWRTTRSAANGVNNSEEYIPTGVDGTYYLEGGWGTNYILNPSKIGNFVLHGWSYGELYQDISGFTSVMNTASTSSGKTAGTPMIFCLL